MARHRDVLDPGAPPKTPTYDHLSARERELVDRLLSTQMNDVLRAMEADGHTDDLYYRSWQASERERYAQRILQGDRHAMEIEYMNATRVTPRAR